MTKQNNHLQKASEIGGIDSVAPLAIIKLDAIKIGWINKSEKAKKLFFLLSNFLSIKNYFLSKKAS